MDLIQVASFSAFSPRELESLINGFIAETEISVKDINFFTAIDGSFGAYVVYYSS